MRRIVESDLPTAEKIVRLKYWNDWLDRAFGKAPLGIALQHVQEMRPLIINSVTDEDIRAAHAAREDDDDDYLPPSRRALPAPVLEPASALPEASGEAIETSPVDGQVGETDAGVNLVRRSDEVELVRDGAGWTLKKPEPKPEVKSAWTLVRS